MINICYKTQLSTSCHSFIYENIFFKSGCLQITRDQILIIQIINQFQATEGFQTFFTRGPVSDPFNEKVLLRSTPLVPNVKIFLTNHNREFENSYN